MAEVLRVKRAARAREAARPIGEKLRTLERLRDRDRAIKRAVAASSPTSDRGGISRERALSPRPKRQRSRINFLPVTFAA